MDRFDLLLKKHNVEVRRTRLANDASLTRFSDRAIINCCYGLDDAHAIVGIAMMLGVLEMSWPGRYFRFRFPEAQDSPPLRRAHAQSTRDYRQAWRWAAAYLLPDRVLSQAAAEGLESWALCEAVGLPLELVEWRLARWQDRPKFRSA